MNESDLNQQALNPPELNPLDIELRDIHLPDPISWWPVAPGWWLIAAALLLGLLAFILLRKIYLARQLRRDISAEFERIQQQFQQTKNTSQLATALSVLLRRASITYYSRYKLPGENVAGLTGDKWLAWLDSTVEKPTPGKKFQSETGKVLLTAPYMAADAQLEFDTQTLIDLCKSWLQSPHKKIAGKISREPIREMKS